ncbi:MAG: hypothetical protein ACRDO0_19445 [Nocardioidaceae bacterium]
MGVSNGTRMCTAGAAAGALAAGALTGVSAPAQAAKSGTCSGFTVSTGGLYQMEPEPGVAERNTLGADYRFTQQRPDGPLCTTHVGGRFSAYDSPELATLASNSATQSRWRVASGGRIGFVVGEDAVEGGCSAQRIG